MADTRDIDLEAILKRLEFLEKENDSLRAEVEELKTNDIEIKAELNTINRFISAMTESQSSSESSVAPIFLAALFAPCTSTV